MIQDKGIRAKMVCHNIYATCRYIKQNVMGISCMSLYNIPTLHIANFIMSQDPNFCICTQLPTTIISTKMRSRPTLLLPCLVKQLYHNFLSDTEFKEYTSTLVYLGSKCVIVAYSYFNKIQIESWRGTANAKIALTSPLICNGQCSSKEILHI